MAGNPVLGFLSVRPTGDGPHATVTKMLRLLGILLLVGLVVGIVNGVLTLALGASYFDGPGAGLAAAGAIGGIIISIVLYGAALFWITFTINAWINRDPRGATHALIIAIIATVFGALGALGLLGALAATAYPMYMAMSILAGLIAIGYLYCGIMILTNRSKATTGTTPTTGAMGN